MKARPGKLKAPNVNVCWVDNRDKKGGGNVYGADNSYFYAASAEGLSYEWDSFDKFAEDARWLAKETGWTPNKVAGGDSLFGHNTHHMQRWLGCASGDDLMRRVEHGWPELNVQLKKMLEQAELVTPPVESRNLLRRRKRIRDDHGDDFDIQRVWNGDLAHAWVRPKRTEHVTINTKRVTLCIDVTANGCITHENSLWRSALGMKLVDSLIKAGRVLEIWITDSSSHPWLDGTPGSLWAAWCVKRSGDPLVEDRLCSMLTVGFMRVCGFLAMRMEGRGTSYGGALNYGLPATLKERQNSGELVLRVGECYSLDAMVKEYNRAWQEVIKHSEEVLHGAVTGADQTV